MKGNNRKVQIALEDDNIVHIISEIQPKQIQDKPCNLLCSVQGATHQRNTRNYFYLRRCLICLVILFLNSLSKRFWWKTLSLRLPHKKCYIVKTECCRLYQKIWDYRSFLFWRTRNWKWIKCLVKPKASCNPP